MKNKTRHLAFCGLLLALALCLSWVERFIPLDLVVPLPGVKLGLANIVTLVVLYFFGAKTAFTVLVLRCVLTAAFGGGPTALAFSLTGGLLAMAVMALARHLPFLSVYGVSVLGAAAHNTGQVLAAVVLLGSCGVSGLFAGGVGGGRHADRHRCLSDLPRTGCHRAAAQKEKRVCFRPSARSRKHITET